MAFPGGLPSFAGFTAGHTLAADNHGAQHDLEQSEIVAIATKIGTGASTPTSGTVLAGNGTGTSAWRALSSSDISDISSKIFTSVYPIGCIYTETTGTNPNTTFGFGTWVATGTGRVLLGAGTSDQLFTGGTTGGESNHTLTAAEMPSHTHIQSAHNHVFGVRDTDDGGTDGLVRANIAVAGTQLADTVAVNQNTGGGGSHNNLPPYLVVYFWQRTA